jgi:hypothetical protein
MSYASIIKLLPCFAVLILLCSVTTAHAAKLSISSNKRYLLKDGEPFLYLCDTGWDLFMVLNREEADDYLKNRVDKGFNVIMALLMGHSPTWDSYKDGKNAYGQTPLINMDPAQPNEKHFQHVDYMVNKANSMGMFVAICPSWSDWMYDYLGPGPHPFTPQNARTFGQYVGNRYKDNDIIWVIGGDRNPEGYEDILTAMAEGLDEGDGESDFLMTFHGSKTTELIPPDNIYYERLSCSSHLFSDSEWLDFHGAYSGHQWAYPTYRLIAQDRAMKPTRPVIDHEPCYENHPYLADGSRYHARPRDWDGETRGTAALIREQAYWAMLAGAAGHTYACNDVWSFHDVGREMGRENMARYHVNTLWREAMDFPGAVQMGIMRRLFESRPWYTMEPDQSIIVAGQGTGENHIQAARASDGKFLLAYLPRGNQVTVDMGKISGSGAKAYWFNPRNGDAIYINQFPCSGTRQFAPPSSGVDNDWVLALDDAANSYSLSGKHAE